MEKLRFVVGAVTDKGNVKKVNQDSILVQIGEHKGNEFGLFIVCDGLGGLDRGEYASSIVTKVFNEWWHREFKKLILRNDGVSIVKSLENVIEIVNRMIIEDGKRTNEKIGTTVSALLILNSNYYIVHIGDSRIYRINNKLHRLTEDHSLNEEKIRNKELSQKDAEKLIKRNILTQCVGINERLDIFKNNGSIRNKDLFLICSDGLHGCFNEKELFKYLSKRDTDSNELLQSYCEELCEEVKRRGERDNISIIMLKINKKNIFTYLKEKLM